jgi:hypothetical protein
MEKYGTYVIYKCSKCGRTINIPYHLREHPPLEKYASFCTHEWEEEEVCYGKTDRKKSEDIQLSEA